jgi:hypothetical protein
MTPSASSLPEVASASAAPIAPQISDTEAKAKEHDTIDVEPESDPNKAPSLASPQLVSSPSLTPELQDESDLLEASSKDEMALRTPPLANGETRLHPLIDEHRSSIQGSKEAPSHPTSTSVDAIDSDAANQYPSPSSGFVPPVTEDDFTLSKIPAMKNRQSAVEESEEVSIVFQTQCYSITDYRYYQPLTAATTEQQGIVTVDEADPPAFHDEGHTTVATSRKDSKSISVQSLSAALSIPRRFSTSSSSSSQSDNHSQAISARSSPSTVAPQRRRSSTTPVYGSTLASVHESSMYSIPVKIRDYAFSEVDPRHVGARDVSAPIPRLAQYEEDVEYAGDEQEEETEEEGGIKILPMGLYNAAYEFVAESEHEMSVPIGQKLRLVGHVEGGWAIVVKVKEGEEDLALPEADDTPNPDKGLVPQAYLEWIG